MALRLRGEVSLDGSGWEAGLRHIKRSTEEFSHEIKKLALEAFGLHAVAEAVRKTVELGEELVNTSRRLGISVEALQELQFAAKMSGVELGTLTSFIEKLNAARIQPKLAENFGRFGIKQSEISGPGALEVQDLIKKIAVKVQESSPQAIVGDLRKIGGRGAGEMIPFLKEDIAGLAEEAHKLGLVMKTEDALGLKFIADQIKVLAQVIMVGLAPALNFLMEKAIFPLIARTKGVGSFAGTVAGGSTLMDWGDVTFGRLISAIPGLGKAHEFFLDKANRATEKLFGSGGVIDQASLAAGNTVSDEDAADKDRQKRWLAIQLAMQNLGAHPDFPDETPEAKAKHALRHGGESSDSLLKVGNFLGASQDTLTGLAQRQVDLLQRIEHNTRGGGRSHATHFEESIFPQR